MKSALAIAWRDAAGRRYVGSASIDEGTLCLSGTRPGAGTAPHSLRLSSAHVRAASVVRESGLPAVELDGATPLRLELLEGGFGAAHLLADALGRLADPAGLDDGLEGEKP